MGKIVILGAGLTGLSAAYHLENRQFFDYALFEKEEEIGGLCRSVIIDGFTFDYTGHLLHINDPYMHQLIKKIIGFEQFNTIERRSFIYSHAAYTAYPFQINLRGLPTHVIAECVEGFITRKKRSASPKTFEQWVLDQFGAGFARHFFFPYQEKIFDYPVHKLSSSWTGRFVPQTSLTDIIRGIGQPEEVTPVGYNAQFFYPKKGGISLLVNQLAAQLANKINRQSTVIAIDSRQKQVIFADGRATSYDQLITTLPLTTLLALLIEKSSHSFKKAIRHLLCNSVINFNWGIARAQLTDKHWIYFPEKEFPFYRLGFPHNFSQSMAPAGCSSLYGEFSLLNPNKQQIDLLVHQAQEKAMKLLGISDDEIIARKVIQIPHAYVIYNQWREKHLARLLGELAAENIHSVGRYGEWKYASMQEAILDGKKIAEALTIIPAHHAPSYQTQRAEQTRQEMAE